MPMPFTIPHQFLLACSKTTLKLCVMPRKPRVASKPAKNPSLAPASTPSASPSPSPQNALLFADQEALRSWLETNHDTASQGTWLLFAKKNIQPPSVTYDQAVDTALCYGWIDGQRKSLAPGTHFAQRFCPRRARSIWSARNVAKVETLASQGRMQPAGWVEVEAAKADGRWERAYAGGRTIEVPADFEAEMSKSESAKEFWDGLSRTERYPFLFRIETTAKAETRQKKIVQFVGLLSEGKKL